MKKFGIMLVIALTLAFGYYVTGFFDSLFLGIFLGLLIGITLLWMHCAVCDTPMKSEERYEAWKTLLHDDKKATIIRVASIGAVIYVFAVAAIILPKFFIARWWMQVLYGMLLMWPIMVMWSYGNAETLKKSKEIYEHLREALMEDKYYLKKKIKLSGTTINPDTPLTGGIAQTDAEHWDLVFFIHNEVLVKYGLPFNKWDKSETKKWNNFIREINAGALKTEKAHGLIVEGVGMMRKFCSQQKTLGELAIWVQNQIESRENEQLQSQLQDFS